MRSVSNKSAHVHLKYVLLPVCLFLCVGTGLGSQGVGKTNEEEQSIFGTETLPDQPLLKRPVAVPDAVSETLKRDDGVKPCLENNPLPPGQPLRSWFIASRIHLDGPNETDLVVLGNQQAGDSYLCFSRHGAHRDVQTMSIGQAGRYVTTVTFHFDGKRYRQSRESTQETH